MHRHPSWCAYKVGWVLHDRQLVHNVTATMTRGSGIVLHGPNGSGKSTFLRLAHGERKPTTGAILFEDRNIWEDDEAYLRFTRRTWSYDGQPRIDPAQPNVWMAMLKANHDYFAMPNRVVRECINRAGLSKLLDRSTEELSLGQTKRMAIAQLLMCMTRPWWFLDEPLIGLDKEGVSSIVNFCFAADV